jgi:hypothetical protein
MFRMDFGLWDLNVQCAEACFWPVYTSSSLRSLSNMVFESLRHHHQRLSSFQGLKSLSFVTLGFVLPLSNKAGLSFVRASKENQQSAYLDCTKMITVELALFMQEGFAGHYCRNLNRPVSNLSLESV